MPSLFSRTERLMGTTVEILIPEDDFFVSQKAEECTKKSFDRFRELEMLFSRFRSDSFLSQFNAAEGGVVGEDFWTVSHFSLSLAQETDGVFNPLVNLNALGYSQDFWSGTFEIQDEVRNLSFENIVFNEHERKITLPKNASFDFGGCAKGYAVDEASKILAEKFPSFLVNAGGDLYASGTYFGEKWAVGIANPDNEDENLEVLTISNGAIATSGSYRRKWKVGDTAHHHIVHGQTNANPQTALKSVTVEAKTAIEADAYATIVFLLGKEAGEKFLAEKGARGWFF
ncbi:MAG: FAD:protein FMN transferase [Candidatus Peregrinibacteria bacterium]